MAQPEAPLAASPSADRPDWLPEQFWDADGKAIKGADLKAQFDELTAFKAGEESKRAAAPEKPELYELKLPEGFDLGEGFTFQPDPADPMFSFGREVAHSMGLDQAGFETLMVAPFAKMQAAQAKANAEIIKANLEALGPKAAERQKAVETWLGAKLGADAAALIASTQLLNTKPGIEVFERIHRIASGGGAPGFTQTGRDGGKAAPTEDEYAAMSPAERLVAARKSASGGR
uniref:Uncharacterized protein n=1 Tax=Bosea sp. NBC_00436 TaxID=2969620 RepID=A0A9E7ZVK0_9HYPH